MKIQTFCTLISAFALASGVALAPEVSHACACGCGVFTVGTRSELPQGTGLMVYLDYDYQDQNINWSGNSRSPAALNPDKEISTSFITPGFQYMFNRSWGVQVELPFAQRYFTTTGGATGNDIVEQNWTALGDMRVQGIYTGFFPDQSLGVTFGLKLPTGNWTHNDLYHDIDRDTEIGTGSTDILLGSFYRNALTVDGKVGYYAQLNLDLPVFIQDQYRPGIEADAALGAYLNGIRLGYVGITPIAQIIASARGSDTGAEASDPVASGYERILLSPGIEFDIHPLMFYADAEFPVYQRVTGQQLIGSVLYKVVLSYKF
jgi:hypothetical protein